MMRSKKGFTLFELLVAIAVLGMVLTFSINSFTGMLNRQKLQGAAENFYDMLLLARGEAINRNRSIYVSITSGANWCYGMDDTASCTCGTAGSCQVNSVDKVTSGTDYSNIVFSSAGLTAFKYDSRRGLPDTTDGTAFSNRDFTFTNPDGASLTVRISPVGRLRMCTSTNFRGYNACS